MFKLTTKERVLQHLKYSGRWCSGSELESHAYEWSTKASVISRRARELVNEGRIERELGDNRCVRYKAGMNANQANEFLRSLNV